MTCGRFIPLNAEHIAYGLAANNITINDQPTSELDYGGQHLLLLYALNEDEFPWLRGDTDPYGKENRDLMKQVFLIRGNEKSREKAIQALKVFGGIVEEVSEQELSNAAARADRTGLFTCPHTGVAFAALFKLLERGEIKSDDRVVVISTAHGLKFTEFKVNYHRSELSEFGVEPQLPNMPVELASTYDAVRDALFGALEKREG